MATKEMKERKQAVLDSLDEGLEAVQVHLDMYRHDEELQEMETGLTNTMSKVKQFKPYELTLLIDAIEKTARKEVK